MEFICGTPNSTPCCGVVQTRHRRNVANWPPGCQTSLAHIIARLEPYFHLLSGRHIRSFVHAAKPQSHHCSAAPTPQLYSPSAPKPIIYDSLVYQARPIDCAQSEVTYLTTRHRVLDVSSLNSTLESARHVKPDPYFTSTPGMSNFDGS